MERPVLVRSSRVVRRRPSTGPLAESGADRRRLERRLHRAALHGLLAFYVLREAAETSVYGGAISRRLHRLGYAISPGSLYPLLHSLEKDGLLRRRPRIVKGRPRQNYELTALGRACLVGVRAELEPLVRRIVVAPPPGPGSAEVEPPDDPAVPSATEL